MSKREMRDLTTERESALRSLFPPRTVLYVPENYDGDTPPDPVKFEVRPLSLDEMSRVPDAVWHVVCLHKEKKPVLEIITSAKDQVFALLDMCVTLPGYEDKGITVKHLPADCLPDLLTRFLDNISPKKWEALGGRVVGTFGLEAWAQGFKAPIREAQSKLRSQ